ncbi:MAG: tetratricopeptide repeat-containing sensor histidine kinase [Mariniphaga sp.]|nr:tetratricopeptide repeat-containing sensor histidine kinase [Mariniphaga sp.]
MFEFLKHITPKTKILLLGFILILIPGAIISYLSLQSINQKAENLQTKYKGTVSLVRDKLESEVFKDEASLRNSVNESFPKPENNTDLKEWLRNIESENPAFKNLFLLKTDGGLLSSSVSLGWNNIAESFSLINPQATSNFNLAEKAEFISKDYVDAIMFYQKALIQTNSSSDHALILSRIGRCYFKNGKYKTGINIYKKILEEGNKETTIGKIPAPIIALSQITDGYKALKVEMEQYNASLELYQQLLDHPWDLEGGEYLYYLNFASTEIREYEVSNIYRNDHEENIDDLKIRGNRLLEQIRFIELINQNVLSEIKSKLRYGAPSELHSFNISPNEYNSKLQLSFFKLPAAFQQSELTALGFQFKKDYILLNLFPEILTSVELGKDIVVGILSNNDSLLYIQHNQALSNYLVAENFLQLFVNWKVALFDKDGKSIDQLVGNERQLYLMLFAGIIVVMLIGFVVMVRAVIHESEVSRMKSEFVSNVSHELKTPLALIRMFGETLDSGIVTDEKKRREFYSIIRKESERLTHLINNVLDFSKMDTGVKKYYFEEADLVEVVRSSLEAYKFHIRDNGFEIKMEFPDYPVILKIDKDAISQALLNLLSNAVKYSENRKLIQVQVHNNSASALISVTDNGVGITKEELKKIFDKFYRVPQTRGVQTRGSGLGLTLTKQIIEAHGGTIEVESEIGKGSTFTINIPFKL